MARAPGTAFEQIVAGVNSGNHDESCARMQAWVDAHPADAAVPQALLWMAQLRRSDRRSDLARPLLERARREGRGTEWALHAKKGLADLDLEARRYGPAIAAYDELALGGGPLWSYVGTHAAADARGERLRYTLLLLLAGATLGLAVSRLVRSGLRSLWPPPPELVYPLPILLLVLIAAFAQEEPEARAAITVALGSVALLWLNGAWLRARPGSSWRFAHAALGVLQAAALLYCAIVWNGLWGKLVDTIAMGAGE